MRKIHDSKNSYQGWHSCAVDRDAPTSHESRDRSPNLQAAAARRSFTLIELLISVAIMTLLSAMALFTLFGVQENAREARTRSQIARLHTILTEKLEAYRTRVVPISIPPGTTNSPYAIAWMKLMAIRELMRMELPERITDLNDLPTPITIPSLKTGTFTLTLPASAKWRGYRRVAGYANLTTQTPPSTWSVANQYAECLYLIVAATRDGDRSALEFFTESEIGDVDGDGFREILDGWGRPIFFFRWAPGFTYHPKFNSVGTFDGWGIPTVDDNGDGKIDDIYERGAVGSNDVLVSDIQTPNGQEAPDAFDPLKVDYRWWDTISPNVANLTNDPFALVPLIYSAGRDGIYDIYDADVGFRYAPVGTSSVFTSRTAQVFNNDPYIAFADPNAGNSIPVYQIGMPFNGAGAPGGGPDLVLNSDDNITNHLITAR